MYSTCLYCTHDLGANTVIETLPIGRRLAFDEANGRLWVVCRGCAKWNLVPFDNRLESIESCERHFRESRTRYSTDNIGLARVSEGLDLVRIGPALRPEFAAWRYGDQFGRRRRRELALAGAVLAVPSVAIGLGSVGVLGMLALQSTNLLIQWRLHRTVTVRVSRPGKAPIELGDMQVASGLLLRPENGEMVFRTRVLAPRVFTGTNKTQDFSGTDLDLLLPGLLARVNTWATRSRTIADAVSLVADQSNPREILMAAEEKSLGLGWGGKGHLHMLKPMWRVAAEIASNEQSERIALEGELAMLERQWAEADRLAKISDALAIPDSVDGELEDLKQDSRSSILNDRAS
ncbi:MAG: hypothetical protein ABIZ70_09810 [Gemmatimonadales bacterium]